MAGFPTNDGAHLVKKAVFKSLHSKQTYTYSRNSMGPLGKEKKFAYGEARSISNITREADELTSE